jgi:hypothetical protein
VRYREIVADKIVTHFLSPSMFLWLVVLKIWMASTVVEFFDGVFDLALTRYYFLSLVQEKNLVTSMITGVEQILVAPAAKEATPVPAW